MMIDSNFDSVWGETWRIPEIISRWIKRYSYGKAGGGYPNPYSSYSVGLELASILRWLREPKSVVFFPYADYDYFIWSFLKRLFGVRILLWSYFSENEYKERFKHFRHFSKADIVLVAGRSQARFLSKILGEKRVRYFPIGVDVDFFKPAGLVVSDKAVNIVHVGNNRRDFGMLMKVFEMIGDERVHLHVVGARNTDFEFPGSSRLTVHGFLEDECYLKLLQSCSIGLLFLQDGGSSNALLEMLAVGLPVIVTDIAGTSDYCDKGGVIRIRPGDANSASEYCRMFLNDEVGRRELGLKARDAAKEYSWERILLDFRELQNSEFA